MPKTVVVRVPTGSRLRPDAPFNQLRLAVARALLAQAQDAPAWLELAIVTDATEAIKDRGLSLERSFHDEDYVADVHAVVDRVLDVEIEELCEDGAWVEYIDPGNLPALEEHLDLPAWLAEHEPRLYRLLYARDPAEAVALDGLTDLAAARDLSEISRQLQRLHRDLGDDLAAAVGHAKELVESACKHVLGQTGPGSGGDLPALVGQALRTLDRHPTQVAPGDPDAQLLKRLFGATISQLEAIAGLRNRVGTGHGRAGDVVLDPALARLAIGQALTAVTYLLRVHDEATTEPVAGDATTSGAAW